MKNVRCEDCKYFACAGYHTYVCELDDNQHGPFDTSCVNFEQ